MSLYREVKKGKKISKKLKILRKMKMTKEELAKLEHKKKFYKDIGMPLPKHEEVGYWRKANHIHRWFVDNCGNGLDKCQRTPVSKEQLIELLEIVNTILGSSKTKNKSEWQEQAKMILPTQEGFFFGGTEYDSYYLNDLKHTKEIIQKVLEDTDWQNEKIIYRASW